ncbi:hypothetical protein EmuJ_000729400 [Echinococcus multilocularis]|uniref:Uncharacterized protein n=1 Tax=Echinococcus multilocularis TaxID=6211 RepID=A0A068Y5C4_ECHMU|nr:hypothetical protein EmuJ_000729400 [Echinococcus multilocularis]
MDLSQHTCCNKLCAKKYGKWSSSKDADLNESDRCFDEFLLTRLKVEHCCSYSRFCQVNTLPLDLYLLPL